MEHAESIDRGIRDPPKPMSSRKKSENKAALFPRNLTTLNTIDVRTLLFSLYTFHRRGQWKKNPERLLELCCVDFVGLIDFICIFDGRAHMYICTIAITAGLVKEIYLLTGVPGGLDPPFPFTSRLPHHAQE